MDAFIESHNPVSSENISLAYVFASNCSKKAVLNATAEAEVMLASRNPKKKAGRKKFRETRHPVYRGVRMRDNGKWVCELRDPKKTKGVRLIGHQACLGLLPLGRSRVRGLLRGFSLGEWWVQASSWTKRRRGKEYLQGPPAKCRPLQGVRVRSFRRFQKKRDPKNKKLRVWLGTHPTATMAARAHDVAAFAFRGRLACLNFADSVWRLPVPKSGKIQDIQKAAAEAAEAFRYPEEILETEELPEIEIYVDDEEDIFEMPGFFASMAEGLMMVAPPQMVGYGSYVDDVEFCANESLWSF